MAAIGRWIAVSSTAMTEVKSPPHRWRGRRRFGDDFHPHFVGVFLVGLAMI